MNTLLQSLLATAALTLLVAVLMVIAAILRFLDPEHAHLRRVGHAGLPIRVTWPPRHGPF